MARDTCGATSGGLTCDRARGHAGDHRGYLEAVDEVLFWPTSAKRLEAIERLIGDTLDELVADPPAFAAAVERIRLAIVRPSRSGRSCG